MAFTPDSRVYLLDTPLDNTYKNQIRFDNPTEQHSYFNGRIKHTFTDLTYVRKENMIKLGIHIDKLWNSNYVMYQNSDFGSKWFYAFITKMEYLNDNTTAVYIETDVYQTWLSEAKLARSFVVREHVNDDTIGNHLIDEGLEYGEYIFKKYQKSGLFNDLSFVVAVSDLSPFLPENLSATVRKYDNLASGLVYWAFDSSSISNMTLFIQAYDDAGKDDAVEFIFTIPTAFLPHDGSGQMMTGDTTTNIPWNYETSHISIDGYIPRNKKLFCYPYNVLSISNNMGNAATFRFEDFEHPDDVIFKIECHLSPNPTVVCSPRNFKKHLDFNSQIQEYALTMGGFPLVSWKSDVFRSWLAQNSLGVIGGTVAGVAAVIGGVATGNLAVMAGGVAAVYSQMTQTYKASIQPDQARGNTQNGSFNIAHGRQDFYLSHLTIKREYAEMIDDYFSMYGYKVNALKVPNTRSRMNWNFIKTIDVNITGSIPDDDMNKLKTMYNNGVTLWHNPNTFLNYDYTNPII